MFIHAFLGETWNTAFKSYVTIDYVPWTKLSSISKRISEKGYDSRSIHYQIILFFVACRARTENKKKREDDTVVCVFQPVAFSSSYFSQFLVKEVGYFTRSTQCKKEIGLQRKDGNTSNCLKMVAIHWFIPLDWIFVSPLHLYFRVSTWELSNKYVIDSKNSLKRVRGLDDRTS